MKRSTEQGLLLGIIIGATATMALTSKKVQNSVKQATQRARNTRPADKASEVKDKVEASAKKIASKTKDKSSEIKKTATDKKKDISS